MAVISMAVRLVVPRAAVPMVELRFRLQREGELATGKRVLRFYRSWESVSQVCMAFMDEGGGTGLAAQVYRVPLADLLAQGEWVVVGVDDNPPRKTRAIYLALGDSGIHTFNITQGSGGDGEGGVPAAVDARVRVDEVPASREVLVVEKPADGQWRVAGYGPTPGGVGAIDLRVVGGVVYAMAVDDYGVQFVADLAVQVGQRIRPKQYSGWVYEITEAGQLPSTEPEWWAAVGENPSRPLGTARAVARRYFQPIAHGPVPVEVI